MSSWLKTILLFTAIFSTAGHAEPASPWVEIGYQDENMHPVLWEPMARAGDPQAQFNVGLAHSRGDNGYKLDDQKAIHWLTLSAEQGYPAAENNLAIFYATGRSTTRDHAKAHDWLKRASSHQHVGVGYENLERIDRIIAGTETDWKPGTDSDSNPVETAVVVTEAKKVSITEPEPRRPEPKILESTSSAPKLNKHELNACTFTPEHFTLQLVGATSRDKITQYIQKGSWKQSTGYIHTQREGKDWFVVVHGDYADRESATQAKQQLAGKNNKLKPWLRSFASLNQYCSSQASK